MFAGRNIDQLITATISKLVRGSVSEIRQIALYVDDPTQIECIGQPSKFNIFKSPPIFGLK